MTKKKVHKHRNRRKKNSKRVRRSVGRPCILVIDDQYESATDTERKLSPRTKVISRVPNEVSKHDLNCADLVLIDYRIDIWPERESQTTPSLKPKNGIALAAVLRSNLQKSSTKPTAFALHSGRLSTIISPFSATHREHIIARAIDMDWVFSKGLLAGDLLSKVSELAQGVKRLPQGPITLESTLPKLLKLSSKTRWFQRALNEVDRSNPPIHILAKTTNGIALLRWLLHQILPYPTFLIDERYLAARLRVTPPSLRDAVSAPNSHARHTLKEFEYRGILSSFLGPRWWRAGIESWIWKGTKGRSFEARALRALTTALSPHLSVVDVSNPVVVLDDELLPTDVLVDQKDATEISPDDWPVTADPAWVSRNLAKRNKSVASNIRLSDQANLPADGK